LNNNKSVIKILQQKNVERKKNIANILINVTNYLLRNQTQIKIFISIVVGTKYAEEI
jgi:hypothetical protein